MEQHEEVQGRVNMSRIHTFVIDRKKLVELTKLYNDAADRGMFSVSFEDHHFNVKYLKYMIEYAEMRLNAFDPDSTVSFKAASTKQ